MGWKGGEDGGKEREGTRTEDERGGRRGGRGRRVEGEWGGEEAYAFVACLSRITIDHESLLRRSTGEEGAGRGSNTDTTNELPWERHPLWREYFNGWGSLVMLTADC